MLRALCVIARPSVCLSVRYTGGLFKTVEVRTMQFSPYSISPFFTYPRQDSIFLRFKAFSCPQCNRRRWLKTLNTSLDFVNGNDFKSCHCPRPSYVISDDTEYCAISLQKLISSMSTYICCCFCVCLPAKLRDSCQYNENRCGLSVKTLR